MKINDIVNEKDKKPGLLQKGGALDRAVGPDSDVVGFLKKWQGQTKRPGPKFQDKKDSSSNDSSDKKSKTQKKTGRAAPARSLADIPDKAAVRDPNSNAIYQYDTGSKKWVNPRNQKDVLNQKQGFTLYSKAMRESQLNERGSVPGVGPIHIDEIEPTLAKLEKQLGVDLKNNVLGSVGKKEFSGDIDIALQVEPEDIPDFIEKLKSIPGVEEVTKSSVIMSKVPIENYDQDKEVQGKTRTGFVQVDFMPGDPGWLKTYYHAPSERESKYKGVFRNIMISSIALFLDKEESEEKIDDGRPLEVERWLWSPTEGLVRVKRTPVPNKAGTGYTKKNKNEVIDGPYRSADEIAKQLDLDSAKDLNSYESLKSAIEKNYDSELVKKILDSFAENSVVQDIGVPDDLTKTESLADKQMNRILKLSGYNQYEV